MSIPPERVYATRSVLADAERLLPGQVLETAVTASIRRGAKRRQPPAGVKLHLGASERFVIVNRALGAVLVKHPSPLTQRPSWRITRLIPL